VSQCDLSTTLAPQALDDYFHNCYASLQQAINMIKKNLKI